LRDSRPAGVATLLPQLHGWLHNRKVRYAAALIDALDLDRVPAPLDGVLAHVKHRSVTGS